MLTVEEADTHTRLTDLKYERCFLLWRCGEKFSEITVNCHDVNVARHAVSCELRKID